VSLRERSEVEALLWETSVEGKSKVVLGTLKGGEAVPGGLQAPKGSACRTRAKREPGARKQPGPGPLIPFPANPGPAPPAPEIPVSVVAKKARKLLDLIDLILPSIASERAWKRARQGAYVFMEDMEWLLKPCNQPTLSHKPVLPLSSPIETLMMQAALITSNGDKGYMSC